MIRAGARTNPFLGPRPFSRGDARRFFGREQDVAELTSIVASRRCVFVYARSGAGKTSLLNAGVIPELERREFTVLPVARVSGPRIARAEVRNVYVHNAVQCWFPSLDPASVAHWTISEALGKLEGGGRRGHVVVIDQFEELTTHYPECWAHRADFFAQVAAALGIGGEARREHAELLRDLGPEGWSRAEAQEALAELAEHDPTVPERLEQWAQAQAQPGAAVPPDPLEPYLRWRDNRDLRFVFAMREDFLARIESYSAALGSDLLSRQRIDPLRQAQAREAIAGPFRDAGRPLDQAPLDHLVASLAAVRTRSSRTRDEEASAPARPLPTGEFVEPTHLQIACTMLWRDTADDDEPITVARLQQLDPVGHGLERFYTMAIEAAAKEARVSPMRMRMWVETELITEAKTRGTVFGGDTEAEGMPVAAVHVLDREGLVRPVERAGASWYELTHDALIDPILRSNRAAERTAAKERDRFLLAGVAAALVMAPLVWMVRGSQNETEVKIAVAEAEEKAKVEISETVQEAAVAQQMAVDAVVQVEKEKQELQLAAQVQQLAAQEQLDNRQQLLALAENTSLSVLRERGIEAVQCPEPTPPCEPSSRERSDAKWRAGTKKTDLRKGIELYNEAIALCPTNPAPYSSLGVAIQKIVGTKSLDKARVDAAQAYYDCALRLDPGYEDAHSGLSGLLYHWSKVAPTDQRDHWRAEAISHAKAGGSAATAKFVRERTSGSTRRARARFLWEQGEAALDARDRVQARERFEASLAEDPSFPTAYYALGKLDMEDGNMASAEKRLRQAISKFQGYEEAWYDLAVVLAKQGKVDAAKTTWDKAVADFPKQAKREPVRQELQQMSVIGQSRRGSATFLRRDP